MPGETVAIYGDALSRLADRATYFYVGGGRYWYGTQPGVYSTSIDVGNVTTQNVTLSPGRYYFVVQAYNSSGTRSAYSAEVPVDVPAPTVPSISTVSPSNGPVGTTVTINGTNFVPGSVVNWNGSARNTTFVSSSQVKVSVLASDLATVEGF